MRRYLILAVAMSTLGQVVDAATWRQTVVLVPNDATEEFSNHFGGSAAVSGTTIVVGAPSDNEFGSGAGAAYVFDRNGNGEWIQTAKLHTSGGIVAGGFGNSVAIEGDRAVVTANGPGSRGAAYIFERNLLGDWNQVAKLQPHTLVDTEQFGVAAAMHGNHVVVTSQQIDGKSVPLGYIGSGYYTFEATKNTGVAYVFDEGDNGVWEQSAVLHSPQPTPFDRFGQKVEMDDHTIAISAQIPGLVDGYKSQGKVFLYPLWEFDPNIHR